ncbi:hypothetical protein GCM10009557_05900 [Virgisporangium ochraceum]|uniref:Uncharacterized protein n=1 Tax=Virgisporangium ochraceum TaxID=65505 RepID=A0A8J3ZNN7_9ACTN|nr:hypothetical protein [Virgisporangium ochraceum]GIJ66247.1 hypothetical protein Voc01_011640 [Virgisporangium ochraceum]
MSHEEGDFRIATLSVVDADGSAGDGTTTAVLTVIRPDGTTTQPTVTPSDGGATHTAAAYEFTAAGEWVERWVVTGKGAGKQRTTLLVAPDPAAALTGMRVYATTTDYATYLLAAPPAGARRALAAASREVDRMLLTAIYDVDDDGLPTDADVAEAMKLATCAQAEYAKLTGDANLVGAGAITQVGLGSLSYTRAKAGVGVDGNPRWAQAAWDLLQQAGLTGHPVGEPGWIY